MTEIIVKTDEALRKFIDEQLQNGIVISISLSDSGGDEDGE